ncbi:hypothetical protein FQA47_023784 [Oryzias melastigma]|uniref:Uncharacterized protein n=1 Tax=Oryzias melastigma TaxID=30732 RepID=A0A834BJS0_ORYME|nr:hypothetical protein FQA47_023784 [Oryzias melastigma]
MRGCSSALTGGEAAAGSEVSGQPDKFPRCLACRSRPPGVTRAALSGAEVPRSGSGSDRGGISSIRARRRRCGSRVSSSAGNPAPERAAAETCPGSSR